MKRDEENIKQGYCYLCFKVHGKHPLGIPIRSVRFVTLYSIQFIKQVVWAKLTCLSTFNGTIEVINNWKFQLFLKWDQLHTKIDIVSMSQTLTKEGELVAEGLTLLAFQHLDSYDKVLTWFLSPGVFFGCFCFVSTSHG